MKKFDMLIMAVTVVLVVLIAYMIVDTKETYNQMKVQHDEKAVEATKARDACLLEMEQTKQQLQTAYNKIVQLETRLEVYKEAFQHLEPKKMQVKK